MKKVTLIFPGQGSQYVGMAKNLTNIKESNDILQKANSAVDMDLTGLMFEGPEEELKLTQNTQPAIVTHSIALFNHLQQILKKEGFEIEQVLGHSVGEYSALVAAEVLSIEDALKAVKNRGLFMQEAAPSGVGSMYAILRVPGELVSKACSIVSSEDNLVNAANFNEPTQTVISGQVEACKKVIAWLEENFDGRMRAIELKISAPFHSQLMKPAEKKLAEFLKTLTLKENTIHYIACLLYTSPSPRDS